MNKTVNMNLGGFFFHIDEDAYQKLNRYFDAIKRSLSNEGREEIMNDIESRISELFSEKLTNDKQVLGIKDVDDVIAVMGQPEDYKIEDNEPSGENYAYATNRSKKLYRDKEGGILGGVAAGLGHYFGVDKVWIRIALVLLVFAGFGTGIIAYIVLWAVTPEAITTSEKLEMSGEPINISNIEKKVKEEFENVSEKFKNADYGKLGNQARNGAERIGSTLGDIFITLFNVFAKFIGAIMVLFASIGIISLLVSLFTLGSTSFMNVPWLDYFNTFNYTNTSMWFISLLFFFAIGIPVFFFLILGLKILVANMRSIGNVAKYTLLAVWIIAVGILILLGVRQATEIAFENKVVEKKIIDLKPNDTLFVKFRYNDYYTKDIYHTEDFKFVQDESNHNLIYSNNVRIEVMPTDENVAYLQIEKEANGKSFTEAKKRAEKINYGFKIEGNQIILDNYFLTDVNSKYRGQEVSLYLYLPKGTLLKPDASVERYDSSDSDFFRLRDSSNYSYRVGNEKIECLNCPADENDYDDSDTENTTKVIINEEGVKIENDTVISDTKDIKELKINKDGIIIKTK
ncbi:PspC domain-containing protein [Flavobacterium humi]|uniref:PspC domain-containing protein n=1 Tax=Flavobacterium humi TaxID=2562683 RepID=A0A4Z0L9I1_9FLAO|nr:PspC domain-containing protein [Flavobacterium humi]TGD59125.1 PspC domain-containing protein [Flavobacterium humi]